MIWSLVIFSLVAVISGTTLKVDQVGDGIDAWEKAVESVVEDDAKKEEAVSFVKSVRKESVSRRAEVAAVMVKYFETDAIHSATMDDYDTSINALNAVLETQENWLVDQRYALKEMLDEEEWRAAIAIVEEELRDQWGLLKDAQKDLREKYEKKRAKADD